MKELAESILAIVKDYRNEDGFQQTAEGIIAWAEQFGDDAEFMLREILHLLPQTYLSKELAKTFLKSHLEAMIKSFGSITDFLSQTEFLDLQPAGKSQGAILELVDQILTEDHGQSYKTYLSYPKTNFIYFDDVLATGGTIGNQLIDWFKRSSGTETNHSKIVSGEFKLSVHLFCLHRWGVEFLKYRLKFEFSASLVDKISWYRNLVIENHIKLRNQQFNTAIPLSDQPQNVKTYLAGLSAEKYEDYAYRPAGQPAEEKFFSSPENRVKYENLLLQKGLEIISKIQGPVGINVRPLGLVNPKYKTFGLGTHFFTWRNIPNNCPLALWWEVAGHNWKPLFPINRS